MFESQSKLERHQNTHSKKSRKVDYNEFIILVVVNTYVMTLSYLFTYLTYFIIYSGSLCLSGARLYATDEQLFRLSPP